MEIHKEMITNKKKQKDNYIYRIISVDYKRRENTQEEFDAYQSENKTEQTCPLKTLISCTS